MAFPSPRIPPRYRGLVMAAARATGLPSRIVATQIDYESAWNPRAVSPAGAEGIAQFLPSTWAGYGQGSPFDARASFSAYAKYMLFLLGQEHGDVRNSLAAYNAGPGNVPAGYGYADTILGAAGYSKGGRDVPYKNPLRGVQGLSPGRIDMGVDYGGTGPIYALGPGVITNTYNAGWPGGAFISERLTAGPLAGHYVYAAENISPQVSTGQRVTADTQIGTLTGGGIETGFAEPPGSGWALGRSQFSGNNPTAYGQAYSELLKKLGAPGGTASGPITGSLPSWLGWIKAFSPITWGTDGGGGGGGLFGLGGIATGLEDIVKQITRFADALDWILNPGHWVRILAGTVGGTFVVMGIWSLTHVGGDLPGAGPLTRPMALPIGVGLVGTGGILLFVAFHNLPSDVTDIGSLFGYFRSSAQAQAAGVGPPGHQGGLQATMSEVG